MRLTDRIRIGFAVAIIGAAPGTASTLPAAIAALDSAQPQRSESIDASGLKLDWGHATLQLESGYLIPVRTPDDPHVYETIFVGDAFLSVQPPDRVEAHQVAAFTGATEVSEPVTDAILIDGNRWFAQASAGRAARSVPDEVWETATEQFRRWSEQAEREGFGAREALIRARLGDAAGIGYHGAWFDTPRLGRGFYVVDPSRVEAEWFGGYELFVIEDFMTKRDRKLRERWKRRESRDEDETNQDSAEESAECIFGDDEGDPDVREKRGNSIGWIKTWMATKAERHEGVDARAIFEPYHYTIDMNLEDLEAVSGTTRIEMHAAEDGMQVVRLILGPKVGLCSVHGSDGVELPFERNNLEILVALERPAKAGDSVEIQVQTRGEPIEHDGGRWTQRSTQLWHPHVGDVDRATYDVSLRWPKDLSLLSAGALLGEGEEDGARWTKRRISHRSLGFSFELDAFDVLEEKIGDLTLRFGFSQNSDVGPELRTEIVNTVKASLMFYETSFVRRDSRRLEVAVMSRGFSQGLDGFLTLSEQAMLHRPTANFDNRTAQEYRMETIAHEVAHQWWGNRVGWASYRDQWLSEGLAEFSAGMFLARAFRGSNDLQSRRAIRLRHALTRRGIDGRQISTLGSVTLGTRLARNHGSVAYSNIVYDKGSAIFNVLTERLGEAPTLKMLGALAEAVSHRTIETGVFMAALEKMSGQELDDFVQQFVEGTGLPTVYATHRVEQDDDGTWWLRGTMEQLPPPDFRYVVSQQDRGWDVVRRLGLLADATPWKTEVPVHVILEGGPADAASAVAGSVVAEGTSSEFEIQLDGQPSQVLWDPRGEVHGTVEDLNDKTGEALARFALHLQAIGQPERVGGLLDRALEAATITAQDDPHSVVTVSLARARVLLELGDLPSARKELNRASKARDKASDVGEGELALLRSRILARAGEVLEARRELRRYFDDYGLIIGATDADAVMDASGLSSIQFPRAEMFGLVAACAYVLIEKDADLVVRRARMAGVDVTALVE